MHGIQKKEAGRHQRRDRPGVRQVPEGIGEQREMDLLQIASLYDGQEVFEWSDRLLDICTDFSVGNVVFV